LNGLKHFLSELAPDKKLTLGYSGGLDSSVLLHMLVQLNKQGVYKSVRAVHIHHGLSVNADSWVEHCRQTCLSLDVKFDVAYAEIKQSNRKSLEQLARDARYALLDQLSDEGAFLVTAQHQDDQAETLLLQLLRGAGPKGLSAMSDLTTLANGRQVLRPLLSVSRAELEDYASEHQVNWIEDESNGDYRFDRNFLRHQLMPVLKSRWPNATKTITRSASLCGEQQLLIESEAYDKLQEVKGETGKSKVLHLEAIQRLSPEWFSQVIRLWLREWQIELPSVSVIQQIYQQTLFAREDAQVKIQLSGFQLRRYSYNLYLIKDEDIYSTSTKNERIVWDGNGYLSLPHCKGTYYLEKSENGFSIDSNESIVIEFGHLSEKCKFQVNRPSKLMKQWFKEWKVPPWERATVPFFYSGSRLVQIGDRVNLLHKSTQKVDSYVIKRKCV
jgi:tRNA(Ile)-lysidine synthase